MTINDVDSLYAVASRNPVVVTGIEAAERAVFKAEEPTLVHIACGSITSDDQERLNTISSAGAKKNVIVICDEADLLLSISHWEKIFKFGRYHSR